MIYLYVAFSFIFGLIIGSFINCLIWRLHEKEGLWNRSYCPKCRNCKEKISYQYPLIELLTAILFAVAFLIQFPISNFSLSEGSSTGGQFLISDLLFLFRNFFIISVMIVIFIYDLRWYLILDIITLPACLVVFIVNLMLGFEWQNLLISGIIGGSFFLFQFVVSRGRWIGGGDIRLGLLMGFALGWPYILVAIFLAYFMGAIITLFWGDEILNWYLGFILAY